jgi:hypothetical protein
MRLVLVLLFWGVARAQLPDDFAEIVGGSVGWRGGGGGLSSGARLGLEQQLKRVAGADPALGLNLTWVRGLGDGELVRLLLLAAVGNFTTGAGGGWQRPCTISAVPGTGELVADVANESSDVALRVLLVILCAALFRQWLDPAGV